MQVVVLNGGLDHRPDIAAVQEMIVDHLEARGGRVEAFELRNLDINPCQGCFGCWVKTPGRCAIKDDSQDVIRSAVRSDLNIYLTPVTFGGYSSELKKYLDRQICVIEPFFAKIAGESHHKRRYPASPRLVVFGFARSKDEESERIFKALVYRNTLNFHTPAYGVEVLVSGTDSDHVRSIVAAALSKVGVSS